MAADRIDFDAEIVRETEFAWLLEIYGEEIWFPKSQVEDNEDGTFAIPEWLAQERGLM